MKNSVKKSLVLSLIGLALVLGSASPVFAHRLIVVGWVEEDSVFIECGFSDGSAVRGGKVIVSDLKGNQLLTGKTNDSGEFQFKYPEKMAMKIKVDAGMGHQSDIKISLEDFGDLEEDQEDETVQSEGSTKTAENGSLTIGNEATLRKIIASEMSKQIKQMNKGANRPSTKGQGPSITDILGGIGYIIGLVGLGMFINYRKKLKELST